MLTSIVSVAATPGGSGRPPNRTDAGPANSTPEQLVVAWFGWACPPPTADELLARGVSVVTSVTVVVNATGIPWPCSPTIWPTPLLSPRDTETVTGRSASQSRSISSLPGGAGPDAAAPPVNMANAAAIVATPHSSPRCLSGTPFVWVVSEPRPARAASCAG